MMMAYVTLREILAEAFGQNWAVPAFDVLNLETVQATLQSAYAEQAPVILMIYPPHAPREWWPGLVTLVRAEAQRLAGPVCLHLDHGSSLEEVRAALDLGFSGVMIDGSRLPLEENIALTRRVVEEAHARGVSVEAELGHVGRGDETLSAEEAQARLTRVEEARQFVEETQVDALAVAVGTVHGLYKGEPNLDFERLHALRDTAGIPLVLHGGSGTPDEDIRRAIAGGICKINIWTEVAIAFVRALKTRLSGPVEQAQLHTALGAATDAAQETIRQKIHLLSAAGRAG
jgi:fructose-bisphosphate aldolase class II